MIRFGLCCKFIKEEISFKEIRYIHYKKLSLSEQQQKMDETIVFNLESLIKALHYCYRHKILAFRIGSSLLPLYTHPDCHIDLEFLPSHKQIFALFNEAKTFAERENIRLSFHPDQYVILNSPTPKVVHNALNDLKYHTMLADLLGADVINIHAGGVYGDKDAALLRLEEALFDLPENIKSKLTLENDDKSFTPEDLLPLCLRTKTPLVYDVHHHRCLKDSLSIKEATLEALKTWNREPHFHISSPKEGWSGSMPNRHHDYIDPSDFPPFWKEIGPLTVDIEAKAKEVAVLQLMQELNLN